jgi:hypothetical protein
MGVRTFDPEVAWAAGFFEGEGTITASGGRLVVRLGQAMDFAPLEAILLEVSKADEAE